MSLHGTLLFHLNLNYSSIEEEARPEVVARCYWPLLGLLDELPSLALALEASAHTLELIAAIDKRWLARLRERIGERRVELVGSGDTQLIGPLVPAEVNRWNQKLGMAAYERLLGERPTTALVNEMAWSQGLVDAYAAAGYQAVVAEWENPRRAHPEWQDEWRYQVHWTESPGGERVRLHFASAIAFQKLQRAAAREIDAREYLRWIRSHVGERPRHLFVYAGDAEVFDFRPGRYATEPKLGLGGEWLRLRRLLALLERAGVCLTTPARLRASADFAPARALVLASAADPIPVKKQPKYNVTRWALSGVNDLEWNSRCHARARELALRGGSWTEWRDLCRAWGSDLRTHLAPRRRERTALPDWRARGAGGDGRDGPAVPETLGPVSIERRRRRLIVQTEALRVELDLRRGLAIRELALRRPDERVVLCTLPHGYFDDIHYGADFYSGHTVAEMPPCMRATDLDPVEPRVSQERERVVVAADVATPLGPLGKRVLVYRDRIELEVGLSAWGERPVGSVRTAILTFEPEGFARDTVLVCANGGSAEQLQLLGDFDHGEPASALVSASAALGATDGRLTVRGPRAAVELVWDPGQAAILPLVTHRTIGGRRFLRVSFSAGETDDTLRAGAKLRDVCISIRPIHRSEDRSGAGAEAA